MRARGAVPALRREYALEAPPPPLGACLRAVVDAPGESGAGLVAALLDIERREGPSACTTLYLAAHLHDEVPPDQREAQALASALSAARQAPEEPDSWLLYAGALLRTGRRTEALSAMREAVRRTQHPLARVDVWLRLEQTLLELGDTAAALSVEARLRAAIARDGRPGLRMRLLPPRRPHRSAAELREWLGNAATLVRAHRAPDLELGYLLYRGSLALDAGDPLGALPDLHRSVALADSLGSPHLRLRTLRLRGRAYSKLGDLDRAERDLRGAVEAGDDDPHELAEAYHNLAHTYEGAGRMDEAARSADRFIELARPFRYRQPRIMSLHDAGVIRWKAGWHAAADAAFREMVDGVDDQDGHHFWAGEYFERTGDPQRALAYYERGAVAGGADLSLNLGGMSRVLGSLGFVDSAAVAARAHDRLLSNQLDVPLLPTVLARSGRIDEAIRASREWMERRLGEGNVQGAALAGAQLAGLLLDAGQAAEALRVSSLTQDLAERLNLTEQRMEALRLKGLAEVASGRTTAGIATLQSAAALARAHPVSAAVLSSHLALGDALAGAGRPAEALAAYDHAARVVEGVTGRIEHDVDRVRYRAQNLAPFDRALAAILREPALPGTVDLVLAWSQRRKAAALAMASGLDGAARAGASARVERKELMARLRSGEALIDYLAVDSTLAAIVITPEDARLVPLPLSPDSVGVLAEALRRPFTAVRQGRVDLARARWNLATAYELHLALLRPILPALEGVTRLFVVPDGPLHQVRFDALATAAPVGGNDPLAYRTVGYVLDLYEVVVLPAPQFLVPAEGRLGRSGGLDRVLAVTRAAPGGDTEVEAIRRAWPDGQVTILRESRATESRVLAEAGHHEILHLATHAVADDRDPLNSHLRLVPGDGSDGYLHLAEISRTPRPPWLVVLSGCETLHGPLYGGEGLMSLARAFLAAGAGGVVATAWPIGPETAQLMEAFYLGMAAGEPPAAALRRAKLALRDDPRTAHPFFWAGITLVGGGDAR